MRKSKGFTLIELIIVVAIVGILGAIALSYYRSQVVVKAKLTEVTHAMSNVASVVSTFRNENQVWPGAMATVAEVRNSLGVSVPTGRISDIAVDGNGRITATVGNIGTEVDGSTLILSPSMSGDGSIFWDWNGGSLGQAYRPKR